MTCASENYINFAIHAKIYMTHATDLELNTRAFAPPFAYIPFIPVGRTKECQECAHIFLEVGSSAVRVKSHCLRKPGKISRPSPIVLVKSYKVAI